jgi:hypothetical protein
MNAAYSPGKLDVLLQGQPDIHLSLRPGQGKEDVTVNGKLSRDSVVQLNDLIRISPQQ